MVINQAAAVGSLTIRTIEPGASGLNGCPALGIAKTGRTVITTFSTCCLSRRKHDQQDAPGFGKKSLPASNFDPTLTPYLFHHPFDRGNRLSRECRSAIFACCPTHWLPVRSKLTTEGR
jgi:hypothetical protein